MHHTPRGAVGWRQSAVAVNSNVHQGRARVIPHQLDSCMIMRRGNKPALTASELSTASRCWQHSGVPEQAAAGRHHLGASTLTHSHTHSGACTPHQRAAPGRASLHIHAWPANGSRHQSVSQTSRPGHGKSTQGGWPIKPLPSPCAPSALSPDPIPSVVFASHTNPLSTVQPTKTCLPLPQCHYQSATTCVADRPLRGAAGTPCIWVHAPAAQRPHAPPAYGSGVWWLPSCLAHPPPPASTARVICSHWHQQSPQPRWPAGPCTLPAAGGLPPCRQHLNAVQQPQLSLNLSHDSSRPKFTAATPHTQLAAQSLR